MKKFIRYFLLPLVGLGIITWSIIHLIPHQTFDQIRISSMPFGAKVFYKDREIGKTPIVLTDVKYTDKIKLEYNNKSHLFKVSKTDRGITFKSVKGKSFPFEQDKIPYVVVEFEK